MKRRILNTYQIKDARDILSIFPSSELVDTTITSPPYWNLKDYGSKSQVGFGQPYEEYLDDLQKIFGDVYKVTKETGSLWIVADTIKQKGELKLLPFDLAARLKRVGWKLHDIIVWHKDKTLPWSHRGKLRNIFEYVLFFSKGKDFKYYLTQVREADDMKEWWVRYPERYSPQGKAPTRTWSIPIPRQGSWGDNWVRHFCPFPPQLVRRIILLTTKKRDVVMDPFAGSGVVLAQARAIGRNFIGFDLRKSYRRMFEKRVLPSIFALEKQREKGRLSGERRRREFSALIWKLRKVKYPRELVRLYEREYGKLGARGILALAKKPNRLLVLLIFPSHKKLPSKLIARMQTLMNRTPLSKYGLDARIAPISISNNTRAVLKKQGMHTGSKISLYQNGVTYRAASEIAAGDFLKQLRNGSSRGDKMKNRVPTIASNVKIVVVPEETTLRRFNSRISTHS